MMSGADRNSFIDIRGKCASTGAIGETGDGIVIDGSGELGRRRPKSIAIAISSLYRLPISFLRLNIASGE
jgi:hypothetical protein